MDIHVYNERYDLNWLG